MNLKNLIAPLALAAGFAAFASHGQASAATAGAATVAQTTEASPTAGQMNDARMTNCIRTNGTLREFAQMEGRLRETDHNLPANDDLKPKILNIINALNDAKLTEQMRLSHDNCKGVKM